MCILPAAAPGLPPGKHATAGQQLAVCDTARLWEDDASVLQGAGDSDLSEGTAHSSTGTDSTVTNSSIKLLKWLRDYGELLRWDTQLCKAQTG